EAPGRVAGAHMRYLRRADGPHDVADGVLNVDRMRFDHAGQRPVPEVDRRRHRVIAGGLDARAVERRGDRLANAAVLNFGEEVVVPAVRREDRTLVATRLDL